MQLPRRLCKTQHPDASQALHRKPRRLVDELDVVIAGAAFDLGGECRRIGGRARPADSSGHPSPRRASTSKAPSPRRRTRSGTKASRLRAPGAPSVGSAIIAHALDEGAPPGRHLQRAESPARPARHRPAPASAPADAACECSMLSSVTRLITVTVRIWCFRQARAMRCSSLRRVPRQVEVDHRARRLQVQPDAAAVGGQEQPAARVAA